jgi:hypothetical protein
MGFGFILAGLIFLFLIKAIEKVNIIGFKIKKCDYFSRIY